MCCVTRLNVGCEGEQCRCYQISESAGNLLAYEFEMLFTRQEAEVLNIVDSYMSCDVHLLRYIFPFFGDQSLILMLCQ